MFTFLLTVHVLTAIIGVGPTFTFGFLGYLAEKQPAAAKTLQEAILLISTRLVIPVVVLIGISGILLIGKTHLDVSKNPWLGAGIILYVLVLAAAIFYQVPQEKKIIGLLATNPNDPKVKQLGAGQRIVGIAMALAVVVIAVLMVWKPGAGS